MFQLVAVLSMLVAGQAPGPYDLVLANGRVLDPETKLDAVRHVGIRKGKIVAVSETPLLGKQTIDVTGLAVAPGFIDLHSHAQNLPGARMQAFDGVTTGLELEVGALPIALAYEQAAKEGRPIHYGFSASWALARMIALDGMKAEGTLETFLKGMELGRWSRFVGPADSAKVLKLVEQGLDEGGIGVGVALGYGPTSNAEEYYDVARLAAKRGVPVFTHIRYLEPFGPKNNLQAHEELIALAAMTGAHMHICHLNSTANRRIPQMLEAVAGARSRGLKITFEGYPYGGGSTMMSAPFLAPESLKNIGIGPSSIIYLKTGERLTSVDRLIQLRKDDPKGTAIVHYLDETNPEQRKLFDSVILHPDSIVASDANPWQVGDNIVSGDVWPLPRDAMSHPRSAGSFTRILARYVRAEKKLTLLEAIRRCSLRPAQILENSVPAMKHKGRVQVGADADIIVFDPDKVQDRATYLEPNQTSVGMRHVIVAGTFVIRDGKLVRAAQPGQAVRRIVK